MAIRMTPSVTKPVTSHLGVTNVVTNEHIEIMARIEALEARLTALEQSKAKPAAERMREYRARKRGEV